ncbi:MAG: homoserine dehydrogenase [Vicinamibacterales bacterium]
MGLNSFQTSGNSPGDHNRCRVGILGMGTVGTAVARRLTGPDAIPHLQLTHICDRRARDKQARQTDALAQLAWTDRFDDLLASDIDIVIETIPGSEPAVDYVRGALLAGKSVVTSNKSVIAHQGEKLLALAERQGRQLRFEGAVGGAMPIVRALGDGMAGDHVLKLDAILNGTSNVVLSKMETTGCQMDEAIAEACAAGFAESDPSEDLDGVDAAAKLSILCALAFGVRVSPNAIDTRSTATIGTTEFAKAKLRGGTIRQVAHALFDRERRRLEAWVAPTFVPFGTLFSTIYGPRNAAVISCAYAGDIMLSGQGAGGDASAVAVIADVLAVARDRAAIVPAPVLAPANELQGLSDSSFAEAV